MGFLKTEDWDVQVRAEIARILDPSVTSAKMLQAENMAVAQIKNYLSNRYDIDKIFTPAPETGDDERDRYIVMITIDLALYHIWSKEGPNNIPKTRELRYNDALEWLTAVQNGKACNLPLITDPEGEPVGDVRIWSKHTPESNRY
jgi:phage gp36-like protein